MPIVATDVSDHSTIFADAPQSLCAPGDAQGMAKAILAQLQQPPPPLYPTTLPLVSSKLLPSASRRMVVNVVSIGASELTCPESCAQTPEAETARSKETIVEQTPLEECMTLFPIREVFERMPVSLFKVFRQIIPATVAS